jgi:steroid delta-isomerase-like uncharacterized protein
MAGQNVDIMRRFYDEVLSGGNLDAVAELCSEDIVDHEAPPELPQGVEGVKAFVQMFRTAFPDLKVTIEDAFESGDRAVSRTRWTGTHQGEFMGIPASGKAIDIEPIDIIRVADGKCAEHWGTTDNLALMQQIGAIPEEALA